MNPLNTFPTLRIERNTVALRTLVRKEITRLWRIRLQTLLPPVITTTLYFLIFGVLMGHRIGSVGGLHYPTFIAPGLIMLTMINNSYSNAVSSFFTEKYQRSVEELLCAPMPTHHIVLGFMTGGVVRGLMVGAVVTVVARVFTPLHFEHLGMVLILACMTNGLFALFGLLNALYAKRFDDISMVPTFVLTPLTYLGGVFYATSMLTPFWQAVTLFNPITYIVSAFRDLMLGLHLGNLPLTLLILTVTMAAAFWTACWCIRNNVGTQLQ